MQKARINWGLISASLYASFQVISNVLSTKIALLPIVHLSMDGGTLLYPFTFTLRDFVHKTCGKHDSRVVVVVAGAISLVAMLSFWLVGLLPSDPTWQYQTSYNQVLLPVLRISVASIVAQVLAELVDTEIFSAVYKRINDVAGAFISNLVSLVLDSVVFSLIAFAGALPLSTVMSIIISNILIKLVISALSVPVIRLIPRRVDFEKI